MTLRQAPRYDNPGVPDQQRALMWRGTSLLGSVKSGLLVEVVERGSGWAEATAVLRAAVRRIVDDSVGSHSPRSAGIVTAVLIGDRAGLDRETQHRLQEGGTYHVIAISGGNIAILSGVLLLALQMTGVSARSAALVTIGCLLAYAQVVGSEASVAPATFAAATFLAARAVDHRSAPLNTVALSATCLLAVSPLLALDAGFLLTFGATLGILLGVPPILSRVRPMLEPMGRWGRWLLVPLLGLFAATVCAEVALAPVAAAAFSRVTITGLALNFVAIPLMAVAQLAGMCAVGGGLVMSELAAPFGYIAHLAAAGIVESARLVDYLPWLAQRVPPPGPVAIGSYYLGLSLCLFGARPRFIRLGGTDWLSARGPRSCWVRSTSARDHSPMADRTKRCACCFSTSTRQMPRWCSCPAGVRCSWMPVAPCEAAFRSVNVSWPRCSGTRAFAGWTISRSPMRIPTTWAGGCDTRRLSALRGLGGCAGATVRASP